MDLLSKLLIKWRNKTKLCKTTTFICKWQKIHNLTPTNHNAMYLTKRPTKMKTTRESEDRSLIWKRGKKKTLFDLTSKALKTFQTPQNATKQETLANTTAIERLKAHTHKWQTDKRIVLNKLWKFFHFRLGGKHHNC